MVVQLVEIRIKSVSELSEEAKREVQLKLEKLPAEFNFRGYAQVRYVAASPIHVGSVDPIEGTPTNFYRKMATDILAASATE